MAKWIWAGWFFVFIYGAATATEPVELAILMVLAIACLLVWVTRRERR